MSSFNLSGATGRVFNLKKITKKLFLITHGTLKPVKFTATSSDVIIEDDILCDGDNCYQIIIENGTIKIDSINEVENVSSEAKADTRMGNNYKTIEEDNDEHNVGSDVVKDVDNTAVGSDCVDDVKNDETVDKIRTDDTDKGPHQVDNQITQQTIIDRISSDLNNTNVSSEECINDRECKRENDVLENIVKDEVSPEKAASPEDTAKHAQPASLERKTFVTNVGIKVMIYTGSILNLDVDCIVNAANSTLDHGGGVARIIADAAGHAMNRDGKAYIRKYGKLSVGNVCTTTPGDLQYKFVIHAVGPRWSDYTRRHDGTSECKKDLLNAVKNAFIEADRLNMKSIALPAISSAILGVPLNICVRQYVLAVEKYCELREGSYKGTLREIHFIDIKSDVVRAIQDAFSGYVLPHSRNKTDIPPVL